ncbi:transcription initiation factor TFIID subunit 4-like [Chroicocephalus ridibundus]|uniref:transcription initiation factor TFIID subunit 4-like n=1 Tax=Chroicocephalus ridibundus TaxID=1192867 RepID=UPI002FDCE36B
MDVKSLPLQILVFTSTASFCETRKQPRLPAQASRRRKVKAGPIYLDPAGPRTGDSQGPAPPPRPGPPPAAPHRAPPPPGSLGPGAPAALLPRKPGSGIVSAGPAASGPGRLPCAPAEPAPALPPRPRPRPAALRRGTRRPGMEGDGRGVIPIAPRIPRRCWKSPAAARGRKVWHSWVGDPRLPQVMAAILTGPSRRESGEGLPRGQAAYIYMHTYIKCRHTHKCHALAC